MNRREAMMAWISGITVAAAIAPTADSQASQGSNPDLDQIRALLKTHDEAFTNQDLNGVIACFTEKASIMGSGPGEIWSGPDEIKVAYEYFFEGLDRGEQKFEYQFRIGGVTPEMGWLMASGNVTGRRWKISTLTGDATSGTKGSE